MSKDRTVLYNSALVPPEDMITVSYLNLDDRLNVELYTYNDHSIRLSRIFVLSDYLQLISPKEIVLSMEVAFATDFGQLAKGRRVFMAGYPAKTEFFSDETFDAPGYELVVSTGPIRATSQAQNAVQVGALSSGGMSGGPMLLEDGTFAGVVCSGNDPEVDKPETGFTTSIVIDHTNLPNFWSRLDW